MNITKHVKSCPIELVVKLINKKWVIQIMRDLLNNGLIQKIVDKCDKKNVKYILTEKGRSLNKVIYEIAMVTVDSENYSDRIRNDLKTSFQENLL